MNRQKQNGFQGDHLAHLLSYGLMIFQNVYPQKLVLIFFYCRSEIYSEKTLQKALSVQSKMDADMGGTEILEPLKKIYSETCKHGYPRQVIETKNILGCAKMCVKCNFFPL